MYLTYGYRHLSKAWARELTSWIPQRKANHLDTGCFGALILYFQLILLDSKGSPEKQKPHDVLWDGKRFIRRKDLTQLCKLLSLESAGVWYARDTQESRLCGPSKRDGDQDNWYVFFSEEEKPYCSRCLQAVYERGSLSCSDEARLFFCLSLGWWVNSFPQWPRDLLYSQSSSQTYSRLTKTPTIMSAHQDTLGPAKLM